MIRIDGKEIKPLEKLTVGQVIEAEKYLQVNLNDGAGAQLAIMLFANLRALEPHKLPDVVANEVMGADLTSVEEVEDPLEEGAAGNGTAPAPSATGGAPDSDRSE